MPISETLAGPAKIAGMTAAAESAMLFVSTGILIHRSSHNALEFAEWMTEAAHLLVEPYFNASDWKFVHRNIHHPFADFNGLNFAQIAACARWAEKNRVGSMNHPPQPEFFDNLDRGAKRIPFGTAREIGDIVLPRMDGRYEPHPIYTPEMAAQAYDDEKPRYLYTNFVNKPIPQIEPDSPLRLEDVGWLVIDPTSPALHPRTVRGIMKDGNTLYSVPIRSPGFEDNKPDDLKRSGYYESLYKHRVGIRRAFIGSHIGTGVLIGALSGHRGVTRLAIDGVAGGSAMLASAEALHEAGKTINAVGHGGRDWKRALLYNELLPQEDGSYESNASAIRYLLLEEPEQWLHHKYPGYIGYSSETGIRRALAVPIGWTLEQLARKNVLGLKKGKGFPLHLVRPDSPDDSVEMIKKERVRTMQEDGTLPSPKARAKLAA